MVAWHDLAVTAALDGRWIGFPRGSTLPERIKAARQRAGLGMDRLAALAGVGKGSIIRLEQGTARVATFDLLRAFVPQIRYRGFARCGHRPWAERHAREPFLAALREWLGESGA